MQKHRDSKAVALKEYYNYSPISTYTESCRYFRETIVTVKMSIYVVSLKIKKPNSHFLGNQSGIAAVCIIDTTAASIRAVFHLFFIMMSLPEERSLYKEPLFPIGRTQLGLAALIVTPSPKKTDGNGN